MIRLIIDELLSIHDGSNTRVSTDLMLKKSESVIKSNTIEKLLNPSCQMINEIDEYLIKNNITFITQNENTESQSFTINDKQYILHEEEHAEHLERIYYKLLNLESFMTLRHTLNKRP